MDETDGLGTTDCDERVSHQLSDCYGIHWQTVFVAAAYANIGSIGVQCYEDGAAV